MRKVMHYVYALRPYQWIKNTFVVLPLVFSGKLFERAETVRELLAALCFCGISSVVYILNDLIDLQSDRAHPLKKLRPLAAGKIRRRRVLQLAGFIFILSALGAWLLEPRLFFVVGVYFVGNLLYTISLKQVVIVDVMMIGLFFILRVVAGAVVIHVHVSDWLLICAGVLALFLGYNKRRHELRLAGVDVTAHRKVLEKYSIYFIDQVVSVLTASTVIFYTLYTVDEKTVAHFGTHRLILTVPFVYYGIFRYLYLVHRKAQGGDPARILWKDNMLKLNVCLWLLTASAVIYLKF